MSTVLYIGCFGYDSACDTTTTKHYVTPRHHTPSHLITPYQHTPHHIQNTSPLLRRSTPDILCVTAHLSQHCQTITNQQATSNYSTLHDTTSPQTKLHPNTPQHTT
ncbi:hypothetical protein Pcinc_041287 [Petrolisthes cinctipes]|uniref:Uncharacterized protein n=1 Tax=Petrolisthes cinctipes TaxID=88211 RepID=A0AAE1EH37_PETCI|nr:hypothetical protein Pcinc_041287 [Petrolisthes cinctipes]